MLVCVFVPVQAEGERMAAESEKLLASAKEQEEASLALKKTVDEAKRKQDERVGPRGEPVAGWGGEEGGGLRYGPAPFPVQLARASAP
jgi:hypothetical protein